MTSALRAVTALIIALAAAESRAERPNILLLIADDLGWGDVGFHVDKNTSP